MTKEEPVAYFNPQKGGFYWAKPTTVAAPITVDIEPLPLYTTPQTKGCDECGVSGGYALYCLSCTEKFFIKGKEWVGLTDEDIEDCYIEELYLFAVALEAKLKEKNGY